MKLPAIVLPAKPKGLRFDVSAVADPRFDVSADTATITIFDAIGGPGVTDSRIAAALRSIGEKPITVQINSNGGDPFVGATIYNLLRGHGQPVTVQILGMAASAASIVAMAGDQVQAAQNSQMMIHRAQGMAFGDADTMMTVAALLEDTDASIAGVYQARTGLPVEQVKAMMAAETFMSSEDMIELGFADALLPRDADPAPRSVAAAAPQSIRDLESQLRTIGLSKSQATRVAAGGWPALAPTEFEPELILAALQAHAKQIADLTKPRAY